MATERKLTAKQQRFVDEYLVDCNATQAAIRAGYSRRTANEQGARLLANVSIQAALKEALKRQQERTEITADRVLQELACLGFSNMLDYMRATKDGHACIDLKNLTRKQAAAIQEITVDEYMDGSGEDARPVKKVKLKLSDKRSSLELLGKHLNLFGKIKPAEEETNTSNIVDALTDEVLDIATKQAWGDEDGEEEA